MEQQAKNNQKEIHNKLKRKKHDALKNAINAKKEALNSAIRMDIPINGSEMYFNNYSDIHLEQCDMDKLEEDFKDDVVIPNMRVCLGGDKIDMPLKNAVTDLYESITNPSEGSDMFTEIVRDSNIASITDATILGNHGYRLKTLSSYDPNEGIAAQTHLEEVAAINQVELNYLLDNPIKEGEKIRVTIHIRHGEKSPANEGAAIDYMLKGNTIKGIHVYISEHTHKIFIGSSDIKIDKPNRANPKLKTITAVNFGSRQEQSEYGHRAGYKPSPKVDGERLRIALVPNEAKTDFSVCVDMINKRELLTANVKEKMENINKITTKLENKKYASETKVQAAYRKGAINVSKNTLKPYFEGKEKELFKESGKKAYVVPFSGFVVGDPDVKNDKETNHDIDIVKKLNGSAKVFLNGDMVHYKKADFFRRKKFADDVFSYIEVLAEKLEPIKEKIVGYNSGVEEQKMMKFQGEELAEYAMTRLQMDEKLVYKSYNKAKIRAEQKKYQAQQVEEYNKDVLKRALLKFYKNEEDNFEELLPYLEELEENINNYKDATEDQIKEALVLKLREEGDVLKLGRDKTRINIKFPLSAIKLKTPHPNLIQHILCEFLDIDPKTIKINPRPNTYTVVSLPVKTNKNRFKNVDVAIKYSKSIAKRGAQENHFNSDEAKRPMADMYIMNTRGGHEYMSKQRTVVPNNDGPLEIGEETSDLIKDVWHISAGRHDGSKDRVVQEHSVNKLYKVEWDENTRDINEDYEGRNIFDKADQNPSLLCSSINYNSALLDEDVFEDVIKNQFINSFDKTYKEVAQQKLKEKHQKSRAVIMRALNSEKQETSKQEETVSAGK